MSNKTWRCFHCDEVFGDKRDARLHFGETQEQTPACQIDVREYRAMEYLVQKYREEDTELHREIARMQADVAVALRRAEENGYASGLKAGSEALAEVDRLNKKCAALALLHYGQPSAFEQSSPRAYVEGLSEKDNADCPACNIGNPGVYVKNGRMVCPHRPEP